MPLNLLHLDLRTRGLMEAELDEDIQLNRVYVCPRLSELGQSAFPELLREASLRGNDATLAESLRPMMNATEQRRNRSGDGYSTVRVPVTAYVTLAEGEFNRLYIRAVCLRSIEDSIARLVVYRAKEVLRPRPESELLIGKVFDPRVVLEDLRQSVGVEPASGFPAPNSGLSVKIG